MSALPRLRDPVELAALHLRHEQAIAIVDRLPPEQRPDLLAAVIWPPADLLEWSLEQALAKLARNLSS